MRAAIAHLAPVFWAAVSAACSESGAVPADCSILCAGDGRCPNGMACGADGYCHAPGADLCEAADPGPTCGPCDQPPADECIDSCRLLRQAAAGECVADRCEYPAEPVDCQFGCMAGACLPEANAIQACFAALCGGDCERRFEEPGVYAVSLPDRCLRAEVRLWGAGGGHGSNNRRGAAGGFAAGSLELAVGDALIAVVGGPGGTTSSSAAAAGGTPGGGGSGGSSNSQGGGGGGGFSGLFAGEVGHDQAIVIAGGGGGSGGGSAPQAGAGGGLAGQSANSGAGGSQTAGFAPLQGAAGGSQSSGDGGGGGGGGYFGGRGGDGANSDAKSGGGGSGFAGARATETQLEPGVGATAGNAADPERGQAGDPTRPGRVIVRCVRLWEP
jgi:hypothetical protein